MSNNLEYVNMNISHQEYTSFCIQRRTKEGDTMCKTISEIQGKKAKDLLEMSGQEACYTVDMEKILKTISISCEPLNFRSVGDDSGLTLGALVTNGDIAAIFYRVQDAKDSHRCRFTIAHELAHACLSTGKFSVHFRKEGDPEDTEERAANVFAGELLVPEDVVHSVIKKLLKPTVKSLSNIFDVSECVIRARVKFLIIEDEILGYNC